MLSISMINIVSVIKRQSMVLIVLSFSQR